MKVLLVEDNPGDARLIQEMLAEAGGEFELLVAETVAEGLSLLDGGGIDVLLTDLGLPDSLGLETFQKEHDYAPDVPIIVFTSHADEETGSTAVRDGAQDYLVKGRVDGETLERSIRYAIERQRAETALREQEKRFRSLIENASDIIVIIDESATFQYASPSTERILGFSSEELEGWSAFDFIHPDDVSRVANAIAVGVNRNSSEVAEFRFRQKAGGWRFFESIGAVLPDEDFPVRIVVNCRDITDRKRAEAELQRINTELDGYAHTVSHDLRGPLSAIKMASDILRDLLKTINVEDVQPEMFEVAEVIDNSVNKSLTLVEDLLALAEAGQTPKDIEEVDVAQTVASIVGDLSAKIQEKGVYVNVAPELGKVVANPTHIYQLFLNLIGNAIAHNNNPKPQVDVFLVEADSDGGHRYLVKDNGDGIPEEDIDSIFIPFFRGSAGGTGIGLATVQKIVGVYGGSVKAYNDHGACFEVTIRDFRRE